MAALALPTLSHAYSFSAVAPSGQTLYYNIVNGEAEVTYQSLPSDFPSSYSNLTGDLTIPSSVTHAGTTYSVTSIGDDAFHGCSGLTSITIPASVTSIGKGAFKSYEDLTNITCLATTPSSLGEYVFTDINSSCTLTVPCGSEQVYQSSDWGTYFTIIQCDEVGIDDVDVGGGTGVRLFPNPARSCVTVAGLEPGRRVTLVDLYGRTLADLRAADTELTIDVSALRPGTYFVRAEGLPARKLVVVGK